jgi:hypothetical protein
VNVKPLPVDLITDAEWQAGCAVRDFHAEVTLDAITGSVERSLRVTATIDDAHRCLAVAQHPAGTISGQRPPLRLDELPPASESPSAGTFSNRRCNPGRGDGGHPSRMGWPPPTPRRASPSSGGRWASITSPRWTPTNLVYGFGWVCLAVIVVLLARGGWQ